MTNQKLCEKLCEKKAWPWIGQCIRPKGHRGKCQGIENGMTEEEAARISEDHLRNEGRP